ncbi:TPA: DUF871 domain-containing protein [Clostridioides difficile]|nr:DUF871 domain-containing protein [Clostridioides difficile]
MERRLGISVYPEHSNMEDDKAYIKMASKYGFKRIFMCMLSITRPKEEVKKHFKEIITYARELGFEVILDIAPNIFDILQISYDDLTFFSELNASGIRLDYGYDGSKEAMISFNPYDLKVELNISNDVAYLDNIITYKPNVNNIYGCHNFYPQRGTGLPYDFFVRCLNRFKKYGIRTAAFVNSKYATIEPWNINDGLCTLEMHRNLDIATATKYLFATGLIDDVIVGNAYASEDELKRMSEVNEYQVVFNVVAEEKTSEVEKIIMVNEQHFRRGDITNQVARSTEVRKKYAKENFPKHDNKNIFKRGDVVIGNDDFGKYKGELQLILQDCTDERKNKVGRIKEDEIILLDFIEPWSKFKIILEGE